MPKTLNLHWDLHLHGSVYIHSLHAIYRTIPRVHHRRQRDESIISIQYFSTTPSTPEAFLFWSPSDSARVHDDATRTRLNAAGEKVAERLMGEEPRDVAVGMPGPALRAQGRHHGG